MDIHAPQKLILVRHGHSQLQQAKPGRYFDDESAQDKLRHVPDHKVELSKDGLRQALAAGNRLSQNFSHLDVVYHSGYLRTKQTALAMLSQFPTQSRLIENILLNERDTGYTHGMTWAEVEKFFPYLSGYHEATGEFYFRFPGGESFADVCERARVWLTQVAVAYAGKNVCAVTHWGMIVAIRYNLEGWNEEEFMNKIGTEDIGNCSATVFEYDPQAYKLVSKGQQVLV